MACPKYRKGKNLESTKRYNPPPISKKTKGGPQTKEEKSAINFSIDSIQLYIFVKIVNEVIFLQGNILQVGDKYLPIGTCNKTSDNKPFWHIDNTISKKFPQQVINSLEE
jgi:hypothetical protein